RHRDVGGREPELAPPAVAGLDDAAHLVRTRRPRVEPRRLGDPPLAEQAADLGRRVRLTARFALDGHEPEAAPLEPELAAHLLEQPHAAVTAIAEVEVDADDDESGAETPDEHLTHEVLGRLVAARVVEVQDHRAVEESRLAEELDLLLECGEQL